MRTPIADLRASGVFAKAIASVGGVVLLIGVVTAAARGAGSDAGAPNPQASGVPRGWIQVVDTQVGFRALLPRQPRHSSLVLDLANGVRVSATLASGGHRIVVERIAVPDASGIDLAEVFRGAVDSFASGSGFQVRSEGATTFRGRPAREGVYVTDRGTSYKALMFRGGAGAVYLVAAPARYFDAVTTSFRSGA